MGRDGAPGENRLIPNHPHDGAKVGWPDWSSDLVVIVASGPSAKKIDLTAIRGRAKVIAIKQNVDLCPWADAVYGCDASWWRYRRGLTEFKGLKITWSGNGLEYPDIKRVKIATTPKGRDIYSNEFHTSGESVGGGGNSGFQALNVATLLFGARNFALVGFDMHDRAGKHWYGRNIWPQSNNPQQSNFNRWLAAFDAALPKLTSIGATVVNCSPGSALKTFPFYSLEEAVQGFHGAGAVDMAGV